MPKTSETNDKPRYTPDNIRTLEPGEIFVFGSNTDGRHGKGAAKFAQQKFAAANGVGEGLTGRCYALPTVGHRLRKMSLREIDPHVAKFLKFAFNHREFIFLVTQVGCGLAGHRVQDIAPMFAEVVEKPELYPNVVLPEVFHKAIAYLKSR